MQNFSQKLDHFFGITKRGSTVKRELLAGLVTFLSLAYILAVNPTMLGGNGAFETGIDVGSVFMATALAAGITTILMGIYAKLPVALAPGMGVNAFFALTVCAPWGFNKSWQFALAAVLISGIIFVIISLTGVRKAVINAIPMNMKYAVGGGIGCFIAFIGLVNSGLIYVDTTSALPQLGHFSSPVLLIGLAGIIITAVLMIKKVKGSIFFGLVATAVIGLVCHLLGVSELSAAGVELLPNFDNISFAIPSLAPTFGKAFGSFGEVLTTFDGWVIIVMFLFVDFFDTAGTLVAIGTQADLINDKGEIEGADRAFLVDSVGTVIGGVLGTSTVTSYIESSTGIEAGGRTGLVAVTTGILLILAIFFAPLLSVVTSVVTGPALVIVGVLMASNFKKIDWTDFTIAVPAFFTIVGMILTYSIANGMALGFIMYLVCEIAAGKAKEVKPAMWVLPFFFVAYFIFSSII
ncbi:MAG: NCS2 family permease [Bacilli bacterium]|nr:NCS2 family permease [Bacilli bacterium]